MEATEEKEKLLIRFEWVNRSKYGNNLGFDFLKDSINQRHT